MLKGFYFAGHHKIRPSMFPFFEICSVSNYSLALQRINAPASLVDEARRLYVAEYAHDICNVDVEYTPPTYDHVLLTGHRSLRLECFVAASGVGTVVRGDNMNACQLRSWQLPAVLSVPDEDRLLERSEPSAARQVVRLACLACVLPHAHISFSHDAPTHLSKQFFAEESPPETSACEGGAWDATSRAYDTILDSERLVSDVRSYYDGMNTAMLSHCDATSTWAVPGCVYSMDDGSLLYQREHESVKQVYVEIMLRSVRHVFPAGKNVSFFLDLRASGPRYKEREIRKKRHLLKRLKNDANHAPLFAIARKANVGDFFGRPSILIPSPYFLDPSWWRNLTEECISVAATRPWRDRRRAALYRGACGPGAIERLELAAFDDDASSFSPAERSALLDVGIVGFIGRYDDVRHCVEAVGNATLSPQEIERVVSKVRPRIGRLDYSKYRYLVHMPGAATGSYSRNLQHLFMHGSIVLIWRNDAQEWYYPLLRNRVHVVYCEDARAILAAVREIENDPKLRDTLIAGATYVARHFFSPASIDRRWRESLSPLVEGQSPQRLDVPYLACSCGHSAYTSIRCRFCNKLPYHYDHFHPETRATGAWI